MEANNSPVAKPVKGGAPVKSSVTGVKNATFLLAAEFLSTGDVVFSEFFLDSGNELGDVAGALGTTPPWQSP